MSMFRTLQFQPRVVTLFTHNLDAPHSQNLLNILRSDHHNKFNIEICQNFPTKDQLEYLMKIDKRVALKQVPKAELLLNRPAEDPLFGHPLKNCVADDCWNKHSSLWVDWEKAMTGTSVQSAKDRLLKTLSTLD